MNSQNLSKIVVAALDDMKGQAIRSINVEKLTTITDFMVIATGSSSTHVRALADSVSKEVKAVGRKVSSTEGRLQSEWVLVDLGDVVVHVMTAPMRALYNLEELWAFDAGTAPKRNADMGAEDSELEDPGTTTT